MLSDGAGRSVPHKAPLTKHVQEDTTASKGSCSPCTGLGQDSGPWQGHGPQVRAILPVVGLLPRPYYNTTLRSLHEHQCRDGRSQSDRFQQWLLDPMPAGDSGQEPVYGLLLPLRSTQAIIVGLIQHGGERGG